MGDITSAISGTEITPTMLSPPLAKPTETAAITASTHSQSPISMLRALRGLDPPCICCGPLHLL
ncbi:hypothetical protein QWZ10_01345 [Paracoccus cavernae]|uniref:Uncharacterized protein n=1 Tax=Paracoccus cavernae TaxID=1571207 RepID=A0ABT8D5W4_9RHOB|nr:hypothetical protein [Paracoccus cavernae]